MKVIKSFPVPPASQSAKTSITPASPPSSNYQPPVVTTLPPAVGQTPTSK